MKTHKALRGIVAGVCLSFAGGYVLAGSMSCQPGDTDSACGYETQSHNERKVNRYQFGSMLSDYGAFSTLSTGAPRHYVSWGSILNHVRFLHGFLFDDPMMDYDTTSDEQKDSWKGDDYAYVVDAQHDRPVASINEPGTVALLSLGLLAIGVIHLRSRSTPKSG